MDHSISGTGPARLRGLAVPPPSTVIPAPDKNFNYDDDHSCCGVMHVAPMTATPKAPVQSPGANLRTR
jgi:hypothetical protein